MPVSAASAAPATLAQALSRAASLWPDQEAIVAGEDRPSYDALWQRVRVAAANLKRLGVKRGDHVAICMGNCEAWVRVAFAAATLGATVVPVNTRFKAEELRYCLSQADCRVLVMADEFVNIDFVKMLRSICPALDTLLPDPALPLLHSVIIFGDNVPAGCHAASTLDIPQATLPDANSEGVTTDDIAIIQYTSGTTSFPKGAMLAHSSVLRDAWEVSIRMGIQPGDRYYTARPLYHVAGSVLSLLVSVVAGACYLTTSWFDVGDGLRMLEEERCTQTSGNDTMFLMMMNHPDFPQRKFYLKSALVAAKYAVMKQMHDVMGVAGVCPGYGLSEASPNAALAAFDDDLEKRLQGFAAPLPGLELRIVDPEGRSMPAGSVGEILIRGWSVMKGYYNMPEQTAKTIDSDGWLHTGDVGTLDEEGRLLFIDRIKDVFRVGGENVAPAEVEDVLNQHPAIKQSQVVGVPDARLIEVPAAYIILKDGMSVEPEAVMAWCKERCANFRVPRYVRIIDTFDGIGMTGSSKIQRNKLREYALRDLGLSANTDAPAAA